MLFAGKTHFYLWLISHKHVKRKTWVSKMIEEMKLDELQVSYKLKCRLNIKALNPSSVALSSDMFWQSLLLILRDAVLGTPNNQFQRP